MLISSKTWTFFIALDLILISACDFNCMIIINFINCNVLVVTMSRCHVTICHSSYFRLWSDHWATDILCVTNKDESCLLLDKGNYQIFYIYFIYFPFFYSIPEPLLSWLLRIAAQNYIALLSVCMSDFRKQANQIKTKAKREGGWMYNAQHNPAQLNMFCFRYKRSS